MNILFQKKETKLEIIVNKITHIEKNILNTLLNNEKKQIEISFFNIKILSADIILNMLNKNINIITNEKLLYRYLKNINFNIKLISYKYNIKLNSINIIAIGGSADSINKLIKIIKFLPKTNLTIFIIIHREESNYNIEKIFQEKTPFYNVVEVKDVIKIKPKTIYIAPSKKHLIVKDSFIYLDDSKPINFAKPSISKSFLSLSNEFKSNLLAILLCGSGYDGVDSLKEIRKNQGFVIIEQPYECKITQLIENAINSKEFDKIFSIDSIISFIKDNFSNKTLSDKQLNILFKDIYTKYGYDYKHYLKSHIQRRIDFFYKKYNFKSFNDLRKFIMENKYNFEELFLDISINTTEFFRDIELFIKIKSIFKEFTNLKIWSAGCSTGEEPYSIAILLDELKLLNKTFIYATDNNDIILQKAKNGIYSLDEIDKFKKNYKNISNKNFINYFNFYETFAIIKKYIKDKIIFFNHNLVLDSNIGKFDIIFCRNVLIYFDNELKNKVFNLFKNNLNNGGYLILGNSENLMIDGFKVIDKKLKIYKKVIDEY